MTVIATMTDPDGRRVELTAERWGHIVLTHPALEEHLEDVLRAIGGPSRVEAGRLPGEVWYFVNDAIVGHTLKVVVIFKPERGFIVTAFLL